MTQISKWFRESIKPPDRFPPHVWAERFVELDRSSQIRGKWRLSITPYAADILISEQDPHVRSIVVMGPTQGGKTLPFLLFLLWSVENDPCSTLWVTSTEKQVKKASRGRLEETIRRCDPVAARLLAGRKGKTIYQYQFSTMTLDIASGQATKELESIPYRRVFCDECRRYPDGTLSLIGKRMRTFRAPLMAAFSTPDLQGDEFHRFWEEGDQREWWWQCMRCRVKQPHRWAQLKWDDDDSTRPGGRWNLDKLEKTIRYECVACSHKHLDVPAVRSHMVSRGRWMPQNLDGSTEVHSYRWNGLLPQWIRWRDLVSEFLRAKQLMAVGNIEALKIFINDSLGEPWEPGQEHEKKEVVLSSYSVTRGGKGDGDFRFMGVDVQDRGFWHVIRACWQDGNSRLLSEGPLATWPEVKAKQEEYDVKAPAASDLPSGRWVFVDSRFRTKEVHRHCAMHGWTSLMGEKKRHYTHHVDGAGNLVRIYSPHRVVDPGIGTSEAGQRYCYEFMFADPAAQDLLQWLMSGQGPTWEVPVNVSKEYKTHLANETLTQRTNRWGHVESDWVARGPNHLRDCEKLICVAMAMAGIVWERK